MIITYLGKQFFKIQKGDLTLALNPISKDSEYKEKFSSFGANLALITINHPYFNGQETVSHGETKPLVINGPGDYEVKNIFIKGILNKIIIDKKEFINTIYLLSIDKINICFLGLINDPKLPDKIRQLINAPDILFIPIGGGNVLSPSEAYKLSLSFNSKIIIPMDYDKNSLNTFLKEGGREKIQTINKLNIKKKDIEDKEGEIIVLDY